MITDRPSDPLSDMVALLRPSAAIAKPISGRGRWAVRYAAHAAPGFTIILAGHCWLAFEGRDPLRLDRGDFLLLPSTPAFTLSSHPGVAAVPVVPVEAPARHGEAEGAPDFVALGGSFRIEPANAPLLLSLLPGLVHVPAAAQGTGRLGRVVALIMEECAADDPGREMILRRLLEVLLVEALRRRGTEAGTVPDALLAALRDQAIGRALAAIHGDVRGRWTVARLAGIAGMSRSAFAARFAALLDCGPIEYVARWRMALAKDALLAGREGLDRIAGAIGYESASAFSTAFRKRFGCSPGRFARQARAGVIGAGEPALVSGADR